MADGHQDQDEALAKWMALGYELAAKLPRTQMAFLVFIEMYLLESGAPQDKGGAPDGRYKRR